MQEAIAWHPPTGTLGTLVRAARPRIDQLRARQPQLERLAAERLPRAGLASALRRADVAVIAEVKRRSPSKGDLAPDLDAAVQALHFARGGAAAVSILTEPDHFGGRPGDIEAAAEQVSVPLIRKDFNVDPLQLLEAAAMGASGVLLIARAMPPADLRALVAEARRLGLEPLVEVRSERELDDAVAAEALVIGVNVRDLETLEMDPAVAARLIPRIPANCLAVWESGVRSVEDVERAAAAGADAVLVGSSLSASDEAEQAVRALTGIARMARD